MKGYIILTVILLTASSRIFAQKLTDQDLQGQFKSLQLNSSPAYVILGVEPENIQRPNSPTDFIGSVQSAIVNGTLQPNFAMETTPYFWRNHQNTKAFNAADFVAGNNFWDNLAKSFTLSVASSPSDTFTFGRIPQGTGIGVGLRVQLCQGKVSSKVLENLTDWYYFARMGVVLDHIVAAMDAGKGITDVEQFIDTVFARNGSLRNIPAIIQAELKKRLIANIAKKSLDSSDYKSIKGFQDAFLTGEKANLEKVNRYRYPLTREGFMLELAAANAGIFAGNQWDHYYNARTSVWLTPSYRFNVNKDSAVIDFIDVMVVGRFGFNSTLADSSDYVDAGIKFQWIHNRFSISGEGILRYLTRKPVGQQMNYSYKAGLTFSYKLNDAVTFKTTFGTNFDGNSIHYDDPNALVVVGGVNFGLSGFSNPKISVNQ